MISRKPSGGLIDQRFRILMVVDVFTREALAVESATCMGANGVVAICNRLAARKPRGVGRSANAAQPYLIELAVFSLFLHGNVARV